tara:strand:+ start:395 stop:568 length:174 start_codon:yes stop_codon:yes gene_type:complete
MFLYLLRAKKKQIKANKEKILIGYVLILFCIKFFTSKINNPKMKADKNFIEIKKLVK